MKKFYPTCLFFLLSWINLHAQFPNDCCLAEELQDASSVTIDFLNGSGKVDPLSGCSCFTQDETETYWFKFDALTTGILELIIVPNDGTADFDFVIFSDRCPCGDLVPATPVACNDLGDPAGPFEPTGLGNPAQWGLPGSPQFQPGIPIIEGVTYYMVVDNTTGNGEGFSLRFGPNVEIGQIPNPGPQPISGSQMLCPGATVTYSVPADSLISGYLWQVTPGSGMFSFNGTNEITGHWFEAGTYEVCVTGFFGTCYSTDPYCETVVVGDIVTTAEDVLCLPGIYEAPDGQVFGAPGVYEVVVPSYLGCDSTIILTLTPAQKDFEVRVEQICGGDCIDFEGESVCETNVYEKVYTNQAGCDSTILLNLVVVPLDINITGVDTLTCDTPVVILDGSTSFGGSDMVFTWTNEAGDTLDTDSILIVTLPGLYTLTVESKVGMNTCVNELTVEVPADNGPPEGVVAYADTLSCLQEIVTLMATSSTPGVTYAWTGPNGFASGEQNPVTTVPGTYQVTVTGTNGCETTASVEVVEVVGTIEVMANGGTIDCLNATVILEGNSPQPGITWSWVGPGNIVLSEQNPEVSEAGTYVLTVTDPNGCTGSAVATVTIDTLLPVAVAASGDQLDCNTTAVLLSGAGSSAGGKYTYEWSTDNGQIVSDGNTLTPTVNEPGTYILTVTDTLNGCTAAAETEVIRIPDVTVDIVVQDSVSCFGESDGTATVQAGGGDGSYTFSWSNGDAAATADSLSEGSYLVTVTDGHGCTVTATAVIGQPAVLNANAQATGQSAPGVGDGTALSNPLGGTAPFSYLWSNGETTAMISGLAPGNYTVTVVDQNGCTAIQTVTVSESDCQVKVSVTSGNISCKGAADGTAIVILDNGEPPFNYIWSNGDTTQTIDGLSPGVYSVTASDANGCEEVASVVISEPAALDANATSTDLTAPNANDGTATANPVGGTGPYTYYWSTDEFTATIGGLAPGEYTVTVTDDHGCTAVETVTVDPFPCGISIDITVADVSCFGQADGNITVVPMGGAQPYTYEWSNGASSSSIFDLEAGTYDLTVTDDAACPAIASIEVNQPDSLILDLVAFTPAGCGSDNGAATVMATGGTPGYQYLWSNGASGPVQENLAGGIYTIVVTDAHDCEAVLEVEISVDNTSDTEPPVVVTQDITIELDAGGLAVISPQDVDGGSTDNCGITSLELDIVTFDCNMLGENTVMLTVVDVGGNTVSQSAIVNVVDNLGPVLLCPDDLVVPYCEPVGVFAVTVSDNCPGAVMLTQTEGLPSGSVFPAGVTNQEFVATDMGGNSSTCTFAVTVSDSLAIGAGVEDVVCFGEMNGSIQLQVTGGIPGYTYQWNTGATSANLSALSPGSYEVTVIDAGGCVEVEQFTIDQPGQLLTALVGITNETGSQQNGGVDVSVSGGVGPYTYLWRDILGNVISNEEDVNGLAAGTYQLLVTDANGCQSSSAYTIQSVNSTTDASWDARLRLYPNPANSRATLEITGFPLTTIGLDLYDIMGHQLFSDPQAGLLGGKYRIDLSTYPEGVYLVKVRIREQVLTRRLVKTK